MSYIQATQFTPIYDEKEDRIRLIINLNHPTRYDIWITRRFLLNIIAEIDKLITLSPIQKQNQDTNTTNTDNNQKIYSFDYNVEVVKFIHLSPNKNNSFDLILSDGIAQIKSSLSPDNLNRLIQYMINCVKYQWGIMV